jgi:uncharacterized protein
MDEIRIQVCYTKPGLQLLRELSVEDGTTLQAAIEESGVLRDAPEIDLTVCRVGVYGKLKALDTVLRNDDRVEIYRPLIADPKESRRKRAVKKDEKSAR